MTDAISKKEIDSILRVIPLHLRQKILTAVDTQWHRVRDIVLRTGRPLCISLDTEIMFLTDNGTLSSEYSKNNLYLCTLKDVTECFNAVCGYSVYTHMNEIIEGFVTIKGGHRVSICGTAVVNNQTITNIRDISSLSLRISRQVIGCGQCIATIFSNIRGGLLICGSPCSGKTTIIRDVARIISSEQGLRTSLIDSRGELASSIGGIPMNDVGYSDVYDSYPRNVGIEQALRTMSPQVIICDEIGSDSDCNAIDSGINSGVRFIATTHASDVSELKQKENVMKLIRHGAFENIAFLQGRSNPGIVSKIYPDRVILSD